MKSNYRAVRNRSVKSSSMSPSNGIFKSKSKIKIEKMASKPPPNRSQRKMKKSAKGLLKKWKISPKKHRFKSQSKERKKVYKRVRSVRNRSVKQINACFRALCLKMTTKDKNFSNLITKMRQVRRFLQRWLIFNLPLRILIQLSLAVRPLQSWKTAKASLTRQNFNFTKPNSFWKSETRRYQSSERC